MARPIKIGSFSVTRFQLFERTIRVNFAENVNILIGANNSGKSTLLMALSLFQFCLDTCLRSNRNAGKGGKWVLKKTTIGPDEIGRLPISTPGDLWPQGNIKGKIGLAADFENGGKLSFTMEFAYNRFSIKPAIENIPRLDEFFLGFGVRLVPVFSGLLPREDFLVEPARMERLRGQRHGEIVRNLLYVLKKDHTESWNLLHNALRRLYPDVDLDVFYDEELARQRGSAEIESRYKDTILKKHRDLIVAGSGFHQAVQIFAGILQPGGSLILLDEPDAHLHARLQTQFMEIIKELADTRGLQFLLATHSPYILRAPRASVLVCDPQGIAPLSAEPEHIDVLEHVGALDRNEIIPLLRTRRVVFLEGPDDRKLMTAFARKHFGERKSEDILRRVCFLYTHQEPVRGGVLNYARQIKELLQTQEFAAFPSSQPTRFLVFGDRDYRSNTEKRRAVLQTKKKARSPALNLDLDLVIWSSNEFENYLLDVEAIVAWVAEQAEQAGKKSEWKKIEKDFRSHFHGLIAGQKAAIEERVAAHIQDSDRRLNLQSALNEARQRMRKEWGDGRAWADAKKILSELRKWLQGHQLPHQLPPVGIIEKMPEVPNDLRNALNRLKRFAAPARTIGLAKRKTGS